MALIIPNLWFDDRAQEAAEFYTSIFEDGKILDTSYYSDAGKEIHGHKAGDVLTVDFEINGSRFVGINGGPQFTFNESVSFMVTCKDQAEIDYYWEKLSADPAAEQCGWCKDKFGLSWQIVPEIMNRMLVEGTPKQVEQVMVAYMPMKKFDIATLEKAYNQE